ISTCLMTPRRPNWTTHQSCPGVRRRRVSHPSIHLPRSVYLSAMKIPRPGFRRFSFSAKNSSFARSAVPPTRAAARSTRPAGAGTGESDVLICGSLTPPIGAVGPWRNEQRNVIFRGGIGDDEADRHAIEKAPLAEIIADEKNELEVTGNHFISREQW